MCLHLLLHCTSFVEHIVKDLGKDPFTHVCCDEGHVLRIEYDLETITHLVVWHRSDLFILCPLHAINRRTCNQCRVAHIHCLHNRGVQRCKIYTDHRIVIFATQRRKYDCTFKLVFRVLSLGDEDNWVVAKAVTNH